MTIFPPQSGAVNVAGRLWRLRIKYNHGCRGGFSSPYFVTRAMGRGKPAPTLDCVVASNFQRPLTRGMPLTRLKRAVQRA